MATGERIIPINIEEEMKSAYIDYSMSVIVSRALPDVRDGLKPVHRRVLYGMSGLGLTYNKSYKKSARIVGEVLGKYHPHGDTSVYDTMVRMAQPWSLRYPLVQGQGNFGSVDGDSPAAMRYTEARLERIADEMLADIDKETVDFRLNFDDSLEEPTVLPARLPNLLVNGASGIAVGMATNMLPHNLTEVIEGITAFIDNPEIELEDLIQFIKAPDFPTGGIIYGVEGVREAFRTGRGRVVVRGKATIEENNSGKETIIITEIPYQVNKANLIIKMAELVNDKRIEGITDIRDESDRKGMRIVVEVRRDAMASVILSKLYKYTPLQSSYGVNNVALVNGRPQLLNLYQMIDEYVKFRLEVIIRRTQYDLRKAEERAHIVKGLLFALDHIDAIITLIRNSPDAETARAGLMNGTFLSENEKAAALERLGIEAGNEGKVLSEVQARAILDMRLQRLTGLERDKLQKEFDELMEKIAHFKAILASEDMRKGIIKDELADIKERYGDERKTQIEFAAGDISIEDMIADEDVVITISHLGYLKRTKSSEYRQQGRGGRGSKGSNVRDSDFIEHLFSATTHNYLLLFTEQGRCFWLRVYEIPEGSKQNKGRVMQNIISIPKNDKVKAYIIVKDLTDREFLENNFIVFCTRQGKIKKTALEAFSRPRSNGINAITIVDGDMLLEAKLTSGNDDILMAVRSGRAIRFPESTVRAMGRNAAGVRGITVDEGSDEVIGMVCVNPELDNKTILVISEKGNGKKSLLEEYRVTNRGGKGVKTMQVTERVGSLVAIKAVDDNDDLMIINKSGITIRIDVATLPVLGRATQGVRVINVGKNDEIADVSLVVKSEEEETEGEEPTENGEAPEDTSEE
ncbi:MAG: DNA gyrase subunit A [Bacteroidota bacterium]